MKSCEEMRREAWGILRGKWFWRLLVAGLLLQAIDFFANAMIADAFKSMSIPLASEYVEAKIKAMMQGLSYSLPTRKAYGWMIGGFAFQMFISYIFSAIFAFGFSGLLMKARDNNEARWLADSFGGFLRPLEITWLLFAVNAITFLFMVPALVVSGVIVAFFVYGFGLGVTSTACQAVYVLGGMVAVVCSLHVVYSYRPCWYLKNEKSDMPVAECLRESRKMIRGFKLDAFLLDLSYVGWLCLAGLFVVATRLLWSQLCTMGLAGAVLGFLASSLAFYAFVKVLLGILLSRAVFYRELKASIAC